jgi:hypothetical protein
MVRSGGQSHPDLQPRSDGHDASSDEEKYMLGGVQSWALRQLSGCGV